jgi:hypothetical protein
MERIDKEAIAEAIGNDTWRDRYTPQEIVDYCEEDVRKSVQLLRAQLRDHCDYRGRILLPAADTDRVLHWSNYSAKAIALIQARGMPIDTALWNSAQASALGRTRERHTRITPSS